MNEEGEIEDSIRVPNHLEMIQLSTLKNGPNSDLFIQSNFASPNRSQSVKVEDAGPSY